VFTDTHWVSGGQTVLANDRNGGRLRLIASRHDDDDWVRLGIFAREGNFAMCSFIVSETNWVDLSMVLQLAWRTLSRHLTRRLQGAS